MSERLGVAAAHFDSASTGRALAINVEAPAHLEAEVDPEKVDRILLNLLSHAYKFTPDGASIRCTLSSDQEAALHSVADSGPGVAPEQREAIFEPFRQGDEGLTRRASGTGLGLAIVRDFVALHGGAITVGAAPQAVCLSAPPLAHTWSKEHPRLSRTGTFGKPWKAVAAKPQHR